ncbi:MAG: NfeD family protein [Symploca sp. SIO2E6]|nr:NfeD family protein [Symploca sp. SIO2E6]
MLSSAILWLLAGSMLCLMELFLPTAFVAFLMGLSALVVALVTYLWPTMAFSLQVVLWLSLSTGTVVVSRRFLPSARVANRMDSIEAKTLTAIPAGETGRVIYEGNSWRARCEDYVEEIAPNEKVYVVRREGNTLVVVPQHLLNS